MGYLKTIGLGILSTIIYAAVFFNVDVVMKYFTRGGVFSILPIVTVFAVSFVYGSFASSLWSMLGIDAKVKRPVMNNRIRPRVKREIQRPRIYLELPR
jgi:uncharacterized membrane protein (DUF485 family)